MTRSRQQVVVAGVDVGGHAKGFHAVALDGREIRSQLASTDPAAVADWCKEVGARAVGVDAPICWSRSGRLRAAERALMVAGIGCFATPSAELAKGHPSNYYGWMLNGEKLYACLDRYYSRFDGDERLPRPVCFETFPQAIACALAGTVVAAKSKRIIRRELLERVGIRCHALKNIDAIDAALCAFAAQCLLAGRYKTYGEQSDGFIVVPDSKTAALLQTCA